ncbi:SHOCT domain-containing protein [Pseudonocardia sp. CA-142604]|uniref:SHOCT domain-containing protein n=1 Tax=Pseudonocardia sp. CA-142604 TaxID=3240024 RepID=UPI003D900272
MAGVIEMVLAANQDNSYPFLELIWTMFVLFGFVLWFWLLIVVFSDLFRRHDMSGWAKAGWTIFVIVLPFIGILTYLIAQGRSMAERRGKEYAAAREAYETDVRSIAGSAGQPADQIATAKRLRDSGDITAEEYETLKRKALGTTAATSGDAPTATGSVR